MRIRLFTALAVLILAANFGVPAHAQAGPSAAPAAHVETAPLPPPGVDSFDVNKSVNAYLSRVSGKDKERSDAYFEGGYVLQGVDVLYALIVAGILMWFGISRRMREIAEGFTRSRFLQVPIYVVQYVVVATIAGLPLAIYEGYVREHHYGLSNQTFGAWAGEFAIAFLLQIIGFSILATLIYSVIRATKRYWWAWATLVTILFMMFSVTIAPVYIAPLFNKYTALPESGMRNAILSMARANGVPADNVYLFDASKQSKRISANVSGMFGTTRISLNDNLMNRCTPSEVLAVLAHEIGHYVLNHVTVLIMAFTFVILAVFFLIDRSFRFLSLIFGGNWGAREIDDPAGLPVLMALLSFFMLLATPVTNTIIRTNEIQADIFGLNAARQPDAFATVTLKLGEYRKLDPAPWEEAIFYDHPSGRTRIMEAMRWKKEHLNDPDILSGPISPQ